MRAHPKQPARILVIEDNPADIFLLRHALNQQDQAFRLEVLRDGEEAIRYVTGELGRRTDSDPCVIVLDLHLPKHDGASILQAIRHEPALAKIQVVALTTLAAPKDEAEVRDLGVRLYRTKPTELDGWVKLAGEIIEICLENSAAVLL